VVGGEVGGADLWSLERERRRWRVVAAARTSDTLSVGALVVDGVYVTIQTYATPPPTLLEVARALTRP
jgi:hypothetical protein